MMHNVRLDAMLSLLNQLDWALNAAVIFNPLKL